MGEPYRLVYTDGAELDLVELLEHVARSSGYLDRAHGFVAEVTAFCDTLTDQPHRGSLAAEWGDGVRKLGLRRAATIVFDIDEPTRTVRILAVFGAGRDVAAAMRRRTEP